MTEPSIDLTTISIPKLSKELIADIENIQNRGSVVESKSTQIRRTPPPLKVTANTPPQAPPINVPMPPKHSRVS